MDSKAIRLPGEETRLKWVFYECGGSLLELHQYSSPAGRLLDRRNCDLGPGHVTFEVTDIEKVYRALSKKGIKFKEKPRYEYLEQRDIGYAVRLPANEVLHEHIKHLLKRGPGHNDCARFLW